MWLTGKPAFLKFNCSFFFFFLLFHLLKSKSPNVSFPSLKFTMQVKMTYSHNDTPCCVTCRPSAGGALTSSVSELLPASAADRNDTFVPDRTSKDCPVGSARFRLVSRVHLQLPSSGRAAFLFCLPRLHELLAACLEADGCGASPLLLHVTIAPPLPSPPPQR